MPSTRRQKAKARKSREMGMMSDFDNLDVMLGSDNNNPIERELADAIEQSLVHEDTKIYTYPGNEYGSFTYENDSVRQNDVRQSFEVLSNEFNLRLFQEMDSMMSIMHSQINRAITTAIAERVIPEIQNIANSMSSTGHRDTEASMSPDSQENEEIASGPKTKIAKKVSRSVEVLRDTTGCGSYNSIETWELLGKHVARSVNFVPHEEVWAEHNNSKIAHQWKLLHPFIAGFLFNACVSNVRRVSADSLVHLVKNLVKSYNIFEYTSVLTIYTSLKN